jgi:hypothetical protein
LPDWLVQPRRNRQQIYGDYIESRNADVYTGHCYAMSELNLVGDQAILAWRVSKGEWDGVTLDGLSVVGVARATGTMGSPFVETPTAKSVLIIDEKATPAQRQALQSFVRAMSGSLFDDVVRTEVGANQARSRVHRVNTRSVAASRPDRSPASSPEA